MKEFEYWTLVVLRALCLLLAILVPILGIMNEGAQARLALQQPEIDKGAVSTQLLTSLLKEMAAISIHNPKFKDMLNTYGLNVTANSPVDKPADHSP